MAGNTQSDHTQSHYSLVGKIRSACLEFGPIKSFRAYGAFFGPATQRPTTVRSELSSSGVTVIDFPGDGQEDTGIKTMLVDIIAHAWDHPEHEAHTYVVISNDRDVGYAVGTLRMRRYRVIVISSMAAHADLTAQASSQIDWNKAILGLDDAFAHVTTSAESKPTFSTQIPTSSLSFQLQDGNGSGIPSSQPRKAPFSGVQQPDEETYLDSVELHDIPLPRGRTRSQSVFSTFYSRKIDGFGDFSGMSMSPKTQPALSVLGDAPLFARAIPLGEERAWPESVPPQATFPSNLSKSVFTPFSEDVSPSPPVWKGKNREIVSMESEPEFIPFHPQTHSTYSGPTFEPLSGNMTHYEESPATLPHNEKEQMIQDILTSSTSFSSRSSKLSTIHHSDITAPTSVALETCRIGGAVDDRGKISLESECNTLSEQIPDAVQYASKETSRLSSRRDSLATATIEKASSPKTPFTQESGPRDALMVSSQRGSTPILMADKATSPSIPSSPPSYKATIDLKVPQVVTASAGTKAVSQAAQSTAVAPVSSSSSTTVLPRQVNIAKASPRAPTPGPFSSSPLNDRALQFQSLITVLRRQRRKFPRGVHRSTLGGLLIKENPQVYTIANVKKFATYISAAIKAGIVYETENGDCVALRSTYV